MVQHEIVGDDMQAVVITLAAGDEIRAEASAMTFRTDGIEMDARMQGGLRSGLKRSGVKTAVFGGEGFFFAALTGRGRVWVQTLPFSRLADRIIAARRGNREDVKRDFGGMLGAIGDLIGGDR